MDREKIKQILRRYFPESNELTIEGAMSEIEETIDDIVVEINNHWIEQEYH